MYSLTLPNSLPPPPLAGVLQVEALAQLGGIVMIDPADQAQQNNFFFGGVDNCRWKKPVVPGDMLVSQSNSLWCAVVAAGIIARSVGSISCRLS